MKGPEGKEFKVRDGKSLKVENNQGAAGGRKTETLERMIYRHQGLKGTAGAKRDTFI